MLGALAHQTKNLHRRKDSKDLRQLHRAKLGGPVTRWKMLHQRAMTETDRTILRERIEETEKALEDRLRELWENRSGSPQEHLAIREARMSLELLRREAGLRS